MKASFPKWVNPISTWLAQGFEEVGMKPLRSLLGGDLLGWGWIPQSLDPVSQTRSSSAAFFRDALLHTHNLIMYKSTLAKKVVLEKKTVFGSGSATGVLVDSGGVEYFLRARREVILSAGVLRSPQMLMLSGIGRPKWLEKVKVPVISNRPGVGRNMIVGRDPTLFGLDVADCFRGQRASGSYLCC